MITLKNGLKQENVDSDDIEKILTDYSHKDCVKIALYAAEDCFHISPIEESQLCIDLIKKWLKDDKSVSSKELRIAAASAYAASAYASADAANAVYASANAVYWAVNAAVAANAAYWESKQEEYLSYTRLFAYQDPDFPYRKESRTFNLDNQTDLSYNLSERRIF